MENNSNKFQSLRVDGWRQFGHVELEVHPRLTVITGANGAGKSSLLRIFTSHFGFGRPFLATPVRNSEGSYTYLTGKFSGGLNKLWKILFPSGHEKQNEIGTLKYTNDHESSLQVPEQSAVQFSVQIQDQQNVSGIHIDSHHPVSQFQQVGQIPTTIIRPSSAYQNYNNELLHRYNGSNSQWSPTYKMKEAIIAMALFGEGNKYVQGNSEVLNAYRGFVETLK